MHPCQSHARVCAQQARGANLGKTWSTPVRKGGALHHGLLIYILRAIHEATDSGNCGARMFFADYSKGFDLIDHSILGLETLCLIGSHPGEVSRRDETGCDFVSCDDQQSFAYQHLRIKFVNDTTALESLPRNGICLLNVPVNDIHKFSIEHNMKLTPKKCKEMLINFMQNDNFTLRPIVLRNNTIQCVTTHKLLGIIISNDLKWNEHIDYISKKAWKRLYSLRILKKVDVSRYTWQQ